MWLEVLFKGFIMRKTFNSNFLTFIFSLCVFFVNSDLATAQAREKLVNNSERDTAAVGHFSRARALLIEALAEFELGKTMSDPSLLLDTERWRGNIIVRAEELNRIIEPKPRITRSGIEYGANSQLVGPNRASYKHPYVAGNRISKKPVVKSQPVVKNKPVTVPPKQIESSQASSSSQSVEVKQPLVKEENIIEEVAPIKKVELIEEEAALMKQEVVEKNENVTEPVNAKIFVENSDDYGSTAEVNQAPAATVEAVRNINSVEEEIDRVIDEIYNSKVSRQ
jgi:hypothetical protein